MGMEETEKEGPTGLWDLKKWPEGKVKLPRKTCISQRTQGFVSEGRKSAREGNNQEGSQAKAMVCQARLDGLLGTPTHARRRDTDRA